MTHDHENGKTFMGIYGTHTPIISYQNILYSSGYTQTSNKLAEGLGL